MVGIFGVLLIALVAIILVGFLILGLGSMFGTKNRRD